MPFEIGDIVSKKSDRKQLEKNRKKIPKYEILKVYQHPSTPTITMVEYEYDIIPKGTKGKKKLNERVKESEIE